MRCQKWRCFSFWRILGRWNCHQSSREACYDLTKIHSTGTFHVKCALTESVPWRRIREFCFQQGLGIFSSRYFLHGGVFFGRFRVFDVEMNSDYAIDTPRFLVHNISRCSSSWGNLHLSISEYQEAWTKTWSHLHIDQLQPKRRDVSFEAQLKCRMPPESEFDYEAATFIWVFSFFVREGRLNSTCLVLRKWRTEAWDGRGQKLIPSMLKPLSTS